ncbi:MAG: efflux transporter outer membrane subunit [Pseudomonadota bacterium]|nr:efflux transporter outer membrane subunit [Pseudomonadota bacterium]
MEEIAQHRLSFAFVVIATLLSACVVGPTYQAPVDSTTQGWKESTSENRGAIRLQQNWWEIFGDRKLTELEEEALSGNFQLQAAAARVRQARAIARVTDADLLPTVNFDPDAQRTRQSANRPIQPGSPVRDYTANRFRAPLDMSYEIDFWGKLRRASESAVARAQSAQYGYQTVELSMAGDIAQNYFALRSLDAERVILRNTIALRKQGLALARSRYRGGITSEFDVSRGEAEVAATEAELIGIGKRRAELENAIAVLLGKSASEFKLAELPLRTAVPRIPAGLPSELLQRRPDVAEAERALAARNAEIGVAKAAFFPTIRLTGQAGFESADLSEIASMSSRIWTLGIGMVLPVFEGGRNKANLERAHAAFDENRAQYQGRVVVAFQEVESSLAGLRIMAEQSNAQARAVASSQKSAQISTSRYKAGLVTYLEVIDTERTTLANQRLLAQLAGQRMIGSVALVKALGGGWQLDAKTVVSKTQP